MQIKQPKAIGRKERRVAAETTAPTSPPAPAARPERPTHAQLVEGAREGLLKMRALAQAEGAPDHALMGFLFDLSDPLAPEALTKSPQGQSVMAAAAKARRPPLITGVLPRNHVLDVVLPVAKRLEGIVDSPIIMASPELPQFVEKLAAFHQAGVMPVVVIFDGQLSAQGVAVPLLVQAAGLK